MDADPCWCSADLVKPTMKPPCVEPSGRSKSSAASEMDTVRRLTNGIALIRSPTSSVCFNRFTARLASERSFTTARDTEPYRVEAVPASSGRHCRAIQDRDPVTARSAFTSPSDASTLLSKHRPRGEEIGRSLSRINLVMSTLMLRSCNCVKWRPPKKHGPSCNNRCHFPNLILCRDLSMLSWCAFPGPPIRWSSTSSNTKQFVIAIPTCHLLAHTPRGPVGSVLPQVHLAALREAEWRTVVHLEHSDHLA